MGLAGCIQSWFFTQHSFLCGKCAFFIFYVLCEFTNYRIRPMALPPSGPIRFFLSQELQKSAGTESDWSRAPGCPMSWSMVAGVDQLSFSSSWALLIHLVLGHRDLSVLPVKFPFQLELLRAGLSCSYQTDLHCHAVSPHSGSYQHYAKRSIIQVSGLATMLGTNNHRHSF